MSCPELVKTASDAAQRGHTRLNEPLRCPITCAPYACTGRSAAEFASGFVCSDSPSSSEDTGDIDATRLLAASVHATAEMPRALQGNVSDSRRPKGLTLRRILFLFWSRTSCVFNLCSDELTTDADRASSWRRAYLLAQRGVSELRRGTVSKLGSQEADEELQRPDQEAVCAAPGRLARSAWQEQQPLARSGRDEHGQPCS